MRGGVTEVLIRMEREDNKRRRRVVPVVDVAPGLLHQQAAESACLECAGSSARHPGAAVNCWSVSRNSSRKSSFASRYSHHQRSSASNLRWASSSRTIFTIRSIPIYVFPRINASAGVGVVERAIERCVPLRSIFGRQIVVNDENFNFGAVRQVRGLIQEQPSVLHLDFSCVHFRILSPIGSEAKSPPSRSGGRCGRAVHA